MKNVFTWIGVILVCAGAALAVFTDIVSDIPALAVSAFGLAVLLVSIWKKSEKKDWKTILAIILICLGGFCCGIASMAENTMTTIITSVIAIVTLIAGVLTNLLASKTTE